MSAAKVMGVIARMPGCAGQAADVVSACTQIEMEDAPRLLQIPKCECPDLSRHKWPKSWYTRLLASCGKDELKSFYWNLDGKIVPNWECLFVHRKQGLFLSVYVDGIKMAGRQQNMAPMWKKLMKHVDLDEPT